jgi:pSer/pThr/pTyr-binding forkhead associated (FHA) protein
MPDMNEKHIAQFEARLEQLVEGAFTNLIRKKISPHDLAMKLARSMEGNLRYSQDADDNRPVAPDKYTIHVHPETFDQFQPTWSELNTILNQQMIELATQSEYRLIQSPIIRLIPDKHIGRKDVTVRAAHTQSTENNTEAMQPIRLNSSKPELKNPQLIINGERTIPLTEPVLNIGRGVDNHIMLDDKYVSRHHVQIRLRFGVHTLFDVNSRTGTYVNNVRVTEHQLQAGDVIRIGDTKIIYVTDEGKGRDSAGTTQTLNPVGE